MEKFDLLVVGAGPIGLACGIEAKKSELSYVVIDKGALVNSLYNYPLNMTFFSTSEKLEIGEVPFISHLNKPSRTEALEYYRRVAAAWSLNVRLYEALRNVSIYEDKYQIETSKNKYAAKSIIFATGFFDIPNLMGIEGEELPKVFHYYKEPHPFSGQKIAVIGAANSAVDVALETYRKGAEVTMIVREDKISDRVKYWVKPDIENRIREGSIKAFFNSYPSRVTEHELEIITPEGKKIIPNDFVLAMTGYKPNMALLENADIEIGKDRMQTPVYNPATMETSRKNIYLAGVVCGGLQTHKWFIENSRLHAPLIVKDILSKK